MAPPPRGLRVVAGTLGGRRLRSPGETDDVRPTTERVREAVFSMLGPIEGRALDLYCGSGAMAIEAISRGASGAVLVDQRIATARANVADLGLEESAELVEGDVDAYLDRAPASTGEGGFDLVFCDPPYRLADRRGIELDKRLPAHLRDRARVICESSPKAPLALDLDLVRARRYGASLIRIYVHRAGR